MPKLRRLSGKEVVNFCEKHNFNISRQKGSHINLICVISGVSYVLTVPNHKELDKGTLYQILKKLQPAIAEEELQEFFYTD